MESPGTDEALFRALRETSASESLSSLMERHWERSYRTALAILRDPASAEDAAQQAFVRVVEAARAGRELDPFAAWLKTVVVNEARMTLRSRRRRASHEERAAMDRSGGAGDVDPVAGLREYAERLPEKLRIPLLLHYGLGLSHTEVAEALRVPRPTASTWIKSGVERLRATALGSAVLLAGDADEVLGKALSVRGSPVPRVPDARSLLGRVPLRLARGGSLAATVAATATILLATGVLALLASASRASSHGTATSTAMRVSSGNEAATLASDAAPDRDSGPGARCAALGSVPAAVASVSVAATTWDEAEPWPPAYPWLRPEAKGDLERKLELRRLDVDYSETPVAEAFEYLQECGLPTIALDPGSDARLHLRLKQVDAKDLLSILCDQVDRQWKLDGSGIRVSAKVPSAPPPPGTWVPFVLARSQGDVLWKRDYRKRLGEQKISAHFDETPLSEVVQFFQDFSGLNIRVDRRIDQEQLEVTLTVKDEPLIDVLRRVMEPSGLHWELRNESLMITSEPVHEQGPLLGPTHVSLDLRGAQVVDLVRALERQGVPAVCPEATWDSRGTFSFVAVDRPLDEVVVALSERTPLKVWVAENEGAPLDGEGGRAGVVVIRGRLASVRDALEAPVPSHAGLAAEVAECRARFRENGSRRLAARADREAPLDRLYELERSVQDDAARIADLLERAAAVASARARVSELAPRWEKALAARRDAEKSEAQLRSASSPDGRALREARARVQRAQGDLDELRPALAAARTDLRDLEALKRGERLTLALHAARANPTFFFIGKTVGYGHLRAQLADAIEKAGGQVLPELDAETAPTLDYAVLFPRGGDEDSWALDRAREAAVTILSEDELVQLLGASSVKKLDPREVSRLHFRRRK